SRSAVRARVDHDANQQHDPKHQPRVSTTNPRQGRHSFENPSGMCPHLPPRGFSSARGLAGPTTSGGQVGDSFEKPIIMHPDFRLVHSEPDALAALIVSERRSLSVADDALGLVTYSKLCIHARLSLKHHESLRTGCAPRGKGLGKGIK